MQVSAFKIAPSLKNSVDAFVASFDVYVDVLKKINIVLRASGLNTTRLEP